MSNIAKRKTFDLKTQDSVVEALEHAISTQASLLPQNANTKRLTAAADFYLANVKHKDELLKLNTESKNAMIYGVFKEAMLGSEAGTDFDIIPFKGKPVIMRKKEGWYKLVNLIKPGEIVRFTNGVFHKDQEVGYNVLNEELTNVPSKKKAVMKSDDIGLSFAHIEFSNGFKKTVVLTREEMLQIQNNSPSGKSEYSPWNSWTQKMCETKIVKELAKELFVLFGANLAEHFQAAALSDEQVVEEINEQGNIKNDDTIFEGEDIIKVEETITEEEARNLFVLANQDIELVREIITDFGYKKTSEIKVEDLELIKEEISKHFPF